MNSLLHKPVEGDNNDASESVIEVDDEEDVERNEVKVVNFSKGDEDEGGLFCTSLNDN